MKNYLILVLVLFLFSCSSYQYSESPQLSKQETWAIMPMINHSSTPLASEQAEQILRSVLFTQGVRVIHYPAIAQKDLASILDDSYKRNKANEWIKSQEVKYLITGSVQEWQYKSGLDGEPAVGLSIQVLDKETNQTLWLASGSRAGWGRESLSATGQIVIEELLSQINFDEE